MAIQQKQLSENHGDILDALWKRAERIPRRTDATKRYGASPDVA
jgi:hypothetical protein